MRAAPDCRPPPTARHASPPRSSTELDFGTVCVLFVCSLCIYLTGKKHEYGTRTVIGTPPRMINHQGRSYHARSGNAVP